MISFKRFIIEQQTSEDPDPTRHHAEMYMSPQGHRVIRVMKSDSSERPDDYEQSYHPTEDKDSPEEPTDDSTPPDDSGPDSEQDPNNGETKIGLRKEPIEINPKLREQKEIIVEGKPYNPNEPQDTLGGDSHKILSQFHPSSWDHHTIAKEFHKHLHKNGYYMHTPTHPLVMSPKDQAFKSGFKRKQREVKGLPPDPTHEVPHHDGSINRKVDPKSKVGTMGKFVALWSSQKHLPSEKQNPSGVSTKIYTKDKKEIGKQHERDSSVVVNNDSETKHSAGPEHNRWFIRAGEIRKIPPGGISAPTGTKGAIKHYGNDYDSYIKDRYHNVPQHHKDIVDYHNDKTSNSTPEQKKKVMDFVQKSHPEFHDLHQSGKLTTKKKVAGEKNQQPHFVK